MKEIKLMIDGKEVQLTNEQLKALGIETRKNPFKRVAKGDVYYKVTEYGEIDDFTEDGDATDQNLYDGVNYFNDDSVAQQVALHQLLYRKLLKFAYDNGFEDDQEWNYTNLHWSILYNAKRKKFDVCPWDNVKMSPVYFSSKEGALRSIREVVKPFIEEHPDFVW